MTDDYLPSDADPDLRALVAHMRDGLRDPRIRAWIAQLADVVRAEHFTIPVGEATEIHQGA